MKTIRIAHLYYDLMNLYGESGNILALKKGINEQDQRCEINYLLILINMIYSTWDVEQKIIKK